MEKQMRLITATFTHYVINGSVWFLFGILNFFDNKICNIIAIIMLTFSSIASIYVFFSQKEEEDEMSEMNLYRAKAITFDITLILIIIVSTVSLFGKNVISIDFRYVYPFLIGFMLLLVGILFVLFEKNGD